MELIAHRINTVAQLLDLPVEYGVELDLRDGLDGRIYISHNPFTPGEDFEEYLNHYHHGLMIANIKSERIEENALDLMRRYGVKEYFFLDSSFPMIVDLATKGIANSALRFSEYEGVDTLELMAGKVNWVWVDTFSRMPLSKTLESHLHELGYRICLVSPDLQKQPDKISNYIDKLKNENIVIDAVCAKVEQLARYRDADLANG